MREGVEQAMTSDCDEKDRIWCFATHSVKWFVEKVRKPFLSMKIEVGDIHDTITIQTKRYVKRKTKDVSMYTNRTWAS